MRRATTIAVLIYALAVFSGPAYTVDGYSSISNLISELGAQKTRNNYVMILGFVILGSGIILSSLKRFSYPMVPFMLFGFFMVSAGIFPHKPMDAALKYSRASHSLHGASATLAGISITVGFIWHGILSERVTSKIICMYLAVICFAFPMLMLRFPEYQGIIQRLMYVQVLGWILAMHPDMIMRGRLYSVKTVRGDRGK